MVQVLVMVTLLAAGMGLCISLTAFVVEWQREQQRRREAWDRARGLWK